MSSDQIDQHLQTARNRLRKCFDVPESVKPTTVRIEPDEKHTQFYRDYLKSLTKNMEWSKAFQAQSEKPSTEFGLVDPHQA